MRRQKTMTTVKTPVNIDKLIPSDMALVQAQIDVQLKRAFTDIGGKDQEYWSFKGNAVRKYAHAYLQYPAMMVPQMQADIIRAILDTTPGVARILDPFVGSGTVLTEAMLQGLSFSGWDINPLAVLICRAKAEAMDAELLEDQFLSLSLRLNSDTVSTVDVEFNGRDKWFTPQVSIALSRIRRAIMGESRLWCRRFFWVSLAETIRQTSNSRTSTFKLHIRPEDDLAKRCVNATDIFLGVVERNINKLRAFRSALFQKGLLDGMDYRYAVDVHLRDSTTSVTADEAGSFDLLVTSPPYGDNATTVPYGQFSYLPLQWIPLDDIETGLDISATLANTHAIDTRSIGGRRRNAISEVANLKGVSMTFARTLDSLKDEPVDRRTRVAAFFRDLDLSVGTIVDALRNGSYMVWVVGNRLVAGRPVPTDVILREILENRNCVLVHNFERRIPSKRMAVKNNIATTMRNETVLVMRKGT